MNELTTTTEKAIQPVTDYKEEATKWLKSTGNLKKFSENETSQFIDICCAYGLNPIKKEVYGIKYGDSFNIIVGYEAYLKRAERSSRLDGYGVEISGTGDDMKATITIYRKDWTHPFTHEVYFSEYNTKKNLWVTKPKTMLKKVAIAQGFRMCFSEELGGIPYTAEELPEEMTSERTDEKPLKQAKTDTKAPSAEMLRIKEILENSKYSDGSLIFNDSDKEYCRNFAKDNGAKVTLNMVEQELSIRLSKKQ